jgi:hypothetical protein
MCSVQVFRHRRGERAIPLIFAFTFQQQAACLVNLSLEPGDILLYPAQALLNVTLDLAAQALFQLFTDHFSYPPLVRLIQY